MGSLKRDGRRRGNTIGRPILHAEAHEYLVARIKEIDRAARDSGVPYYRIKQKELFAELKELGEPIDRSVANHYIRRAAKEVLKGRMPKPRKGAHLMVPTSGKATVAWMHGPNKSKVRTQSLRFANGFNKSLQIPAGNIVSLPFTKFKETKAFFRKLNLVDPGQSHYYFFEKDKKKFRKVANAYTSFRSMGDTTLVFGDMLGLCSDIVRDASVVAFDLDFMEAITEENLPRIRDLLQSKMHPVASYVFLNSAYSRSTNFEEVLAAHKAVAAVAPRYRRGLQVEVVHQKYKDSFPMLATTVVLHHGR